MKLKQQQQQMVSNVPNTYNNMCYDIASANKICYAFLFIKKKKKRRCRVE